MSSWYNYLTELYSEKSSDLDLTDLEMTTDCPLDYPFDCKEINEFIKFGKDILLLQIVNLFNRILKFGTFLDCLNISLTSFLPQNNEMYE